MEAEAVKPIESRKRRRRRHERIPLQARLTFEERGKGYIGSISRDLARDLFSDTTTGAVHHVALAPWQPPTQTLLEDGSWTVVPVRIAEADAPLSFVRFPASSAAVQSLSQAVSGAPRAKGGIEVLVVDVQPLALQTVFVRVDGDALQKHEDVQRKFGGGFQPQANGSIGRGKGKAIDRPRSPQSLDEELRKAMRAAFVSPAIVHKNDLFNIPLPAHPITHAQFPPVEVVLCEPVDQGVVSAETRIVIDVDSRGKHGYSRHTLRSSRQVSFHDGPAFSSSSGDDTTDNFYSATEAENATDDPASGPMPGDAGEASATDTETEDETTDDEENAISLSQPTLPPQASGVLSSMTAATPRPFGMRNGIASPGSIMSGYTATTARGGLPSAKSFEVKPLTKRIPDSILHPPPISDDDDESRIYVDVKMLVRIGCFSGDWVKVTVAPSPDSKDGLWPMGAFGDDEFEANCRTVKVFGLADLAAAEAQQKQRSGMVRRGSISSVLALSRPSPSAYLSPILFANLGKPSNVTLAPLSSQAGESRVIRSKVPASASPPLAKEITLLRMPTPAATERSTQAGLFASLKYHFERRRRLLQTGDLVAVTFDASTSRILAEAPAGQDGENDLDELLVSAGGDFSGTRPDVAWFKVGQIVRQAQDDHATDPVIWADVSAIEPGITRIAQAGIETAPVPVPSEVPWDIYLGSRSRPRQSGAQSLPVESLDSVPRPYVSSLQRRLRELFAVASSLKALRLNLQPIVVLLHSTQRGIGKATVVSKAATDLGLHFFPIDSYDLVSEGGAGGGDVKTEATLRHRVERALQCGAQYTVPMIQHAEALTADRTAAAIKDLLKELRILVLSTTELDKIPENVRSLVTHELEVSAPDEGEREGILSAIIQDRGIKLGPDVEIKAIAVKTAALVAGDLVDVLERAQVVRQSRLESLASSESQPSSELLVRDLLVAGGAAARCLTKPDLDIAVEAARKSFADSIGAPKIPNVTWDDVGGLANVKDAVMETIQLPLERPELFAKGMKKRSGILFYGPPGTGKTLLAKAIATEFSLNFFSVKGPELLNMYIGESEANVRRVFQRARDARPCVVFFDELDSVAPKRGNQGDSGGVMDRIVSQLLAELDGMSGGDSGSTGGGGGVFVIGATNRPDLLDQALLRPGRFDKMLYLSIADTHDKQLAILEALTRKFSLDPSLNLRNVAERLPLLYTGADMYALCSDAMLKAITRKATAVDDKIKQMADPVSTAHYFDHIATKEDIEVSVTEADFIAAQAELVGSVSAKELEHYQRVRETFEAPDKNAASKAAVQQPTTTQSHLSPPSSRAVTSTSTPKSSRLPIGSGKGSGKGKGKAAATGSDGHDSEDDEAYVTSNDFSPYRGTNGSAGKGKGKAVAGGFEDAADNDDEELYG